jgi:hypothetical protein
MAFILAIFLFAIWSFTPSGMEWHENRAEQYPYTTGVQQNFKIGKMEPKKPLVNEDGYLLDQDTLMPILDKEGKRVKLAQ